MSPSPLNEIIRADVEDARAKLLNEVVEPWMFFNAHGVEIKKADGRPISYSGLEFSGTPMLVFWDGFIDDHLKKASRQLIESARLKAIERNVPVADALADCLMHLRNMIQMAFNRMATIDQRLRGKGFPDSVKRKDVTDRIERSYIEIQKLIDSEIQCIKTESTDHSEPPSLVKHLSWIFRKKTWKKHPVLAPVALAVVLVPILLGIINLINKQEANQRVDPTVKTPVESGNVQGTAGHP